jgi:hypothetical protein
MPLSIVSGEPTGFAVGKKKWKKRSGPICALEDLVGDVGEGLEFEPPRTSHRNGTVIPGTLRPTARPRAISSGTIG